MIRHTPRLQTRQPDVLLISQVRLAQGGGIPKIGSLAVAPELIVEIVSSSETQRVLADKLADYAAIGVEEVWVVRPETRTVEALRPTPDSPRHLAEHHEGKTVASSTFPTLAVSVADVFAE